MYEGATKNMQKCFVLRRLASSSSSSSYFHFSFMRAIYRHFAVKRGFKGTQNTHEYVA